MRHSRAFSLIELLVVIGIIAVIIGITMPVISKAREAARRTQCASQLRQIGVGLVRYYNEFRALPARPGQLVHANPHVFKWAGSPTPADDVSELMLKHIGPKAIFYCPSGHQDRTADTWWPYQSGTIATTYQFPFFLPSNLWQFPKPDYRRLRSELVLAADVLATTDAVNTIIEHNHTRANGGEPNGMNMLFGDGHVTWRHASKGWVSYGTHWWLIFWHYAEE